MDGRQALTQQVCCTFASTGPQSSNSNQKASSCTSASSNNSISISDSTSSNLVQLQARNSQLDSSSISSTISLTSNSSAGQLLNSPLTSLQATSSSSSSSLSTPASGPSSSSSKSSSSSSSSSASSSSSSSCSASSESCPNLTQLTRNTAATKEMQVASLSNYHSLPIHQHQSNQRILGHVQQPQHLPLYHATPFGPSSVITDATFPVFQSVIFQPVAQSHIQQQHIGQQHAQPHQNHQQAHHIDVPSLNQTNQHDNQGQGQQQQQLHHSSPPPPATQAQQQQLEQSFVNLICVTNSASTQAGTQQQAYQAHHELPVNKLDVTGAGITLDSHQVSAYNSSASSTSSITYEHASSQHTSANTSPMMGSFREHPSSGPTSLTQEHGVDVSNANGQHNGTGVPRQQHQVFPLTRRFINGHHSHGHHHHNHQGRSGSYGKGKYMGKVIRGKNVASHNAQVSANTEHSNGSIQQLQQDSFPTNNIANSNNGSVVSTNVAISGNGGGKCGNRRQQHSNGGGKNLRKTFNCPTCNKVFTEKFNMKRHMQIHSQSRPKYICTECSKSFAWKDNFIRHKKAAHCSRRA